MANRTFKKFTIAAGGTPQPLVGTTLSAAILANPGQQSIPVADSSIFLQGDTIILDVNSGAPNIEEMTRVDSVVDGTHIKVTGLQFNHAINAFVRSALKINSVYVQLTPGNLGLFFIGTQGLVKGTFAKVIATVLNTAAGVQPLDFSDARTFGPNTSQAGDFWVDGTTGDGYLPSFGII